jgi:hypothetical protein
VRNLVRLYRKGMLRLKPIPRTFTIHRLFVAILLLLGSSYVAPHAAAQDTPLLSGGVGFFSSTNAGQTSYIPTISPVLEAPLGDRFQLESRAALLEIFFPNGTSGYDTTHFVGLNYLQLDYLATSHLTIVGGYFLTPFGTYNERLSPIWISNLQDAPLISSLGTYTGSGLGGMARGSLVSTPNFSVDYAAYFSAHSSNEQFVSSRSTGGRLDVYLPKQRLEIGASFGRLLEATQANTYGVHVWWEPWSAPLKFRSEYAHGPHSQGYWIETDYRLSHFGGPDSLIGRLEPIFRWQQTFRDIPDPFDGLPAADARRTDFGLDYHLPHEVRINTSYAREFTSTGNFNVWETGIVYRFLFPAWKGKQ